MEEEKIVVVERAEGVFHISKKQDYVEVIKDLRWRVRVNDEGVMELEDMLKGRIFSVYDK